MTANRQHRRRQRQILHWAQNGRCAGCGRGIGWKGKSPKSKWSYPTFDHFDLKSMGGQRSLWNGLLKHRPWAARGGAPPTACDIIWHWNVVDRLMSPEAEAAWPEQIHDIRQSHGGMVAG